MDMLKLRELTYYKRTSDREIVTTWPHAFRPEMSPNEMAAAGFWFEGDPQCDKVQCQYCHIELDHWTPSDTPPIIRHIKLSPKCAYAQTVITKNTDLKVQLIPIPFHLLVFYL